MRTWLFVWSTLLLVAIGAIAAIAWQGPIAGLGGSARAQAPVVVSIDMDPTGNSCPFNGTDCTLGTVEACISTLDVGDVFQFDVFMDDLPSGESYLAAGIAGVAGSLFDDLLARNAQPPLVAATDVSA